MTSPFETKRELRNLSSELLKHCTAAIETDLKLRQSGLQYPSNKSAINAALHCNAKASVERKKLRRSFCGSVTRSYLILQDIQEMLDRLYGKAILFKSIIDYRYTCQICHDVHYELRFFIQFINALHSLVYHAAQGKQT